MNANTDAVRALYLELRALGLKVSAEEDPDGTTLDYRLVIDGLRSIPRDRLSEIKRRAARQQEDLVRLVLDHRDPDLEAIRKEGQC